MSVLVVGLALWWPFYRKFEYAALFSLHASPSDAMWIAYAPTMVLLFMLLIAGGLLHVRVERFLGGHTVTSCLVCASASAGWLLVYAAPLFAPVDPAVEAIGYALSALGYTALTLCWGVCLSRTSAKSAALALSLATILSTLTQAMAFLPDTYVLVGSILSPLLSAILWLLYGIPGPNTAASPKTASGMPLGTIAMLGVFLIAGRIGVGLLSYTTQAIPSVDRLLTIGITVVITVCLIVAAARTRDWSRLFQLAWSTLAVIFMAAMFVLLADNDIAGHVATATLSAILSCFEMALFVILAMNSSLCATSGVLVFGVAAALFRVVPNFAGKTLTPLLLSGDMAWAEQVVTMVIPVMLFMLVVATIVFMNARIMGKVNWFESSNVGGTATIRQDDSMAPGEIGSSTEAEKCLTLAKESGLTPRETDVLVLMSEGRSYQKIADTLNISLGTVQGHVKCVYRKLGVHAKQEIIELVRSR